MHPKTGVAQASRLCASVAGGRRNGVFVRTLKAGTNPSVLTSCQQQALRRRLLAWYDRNKRDLPWRRCGSDAYAQMVAEFMLQQTQVATVIDYYRRWMRRFPTVRRLAAADLNEVLACWAGLGYYRRARNLHEAARRIMRDHGGQLPVDIAALMRLPGIGRYTAGAIASIASDVRAPVVDGNVTRVLMRLLGRKTKTHSPALNRSLWTAAEQLLPARRCGDFNQALMELGATLCTPRTPACMRCPLHVDCVAFREGLTDKIPAAKSRTTVRPMSMVVAAVRCGEHWLFVRRPHRGLWAGLWELPTEPVNDGEQPDAARKRLRKRLPTGCRLAGEVTKQVTRLLSHRKITFHIYRGTAGNLRGGADTMRWVQATQWPKLGVSRACAAIIEALNEG